jgi:hypothetical protein
MTCFTSSRHALLGVVVCGHKALEFVPVYYHAVEVRVSKAEQRSAFFFSLSGVSVCTFVLVKQVKRVLLRLSPITPSWFVSAE